MQVVLEVQVESGNEGLIQPVGLHATINLGKIHGTYTWTNNARHVLNLSNVKVSTFTRGERHIIQYKFNTNCYLSKKKYMQIIMSAKRRNISASNALTSPYKSVRVQRLGEKPGTLVYSNARVDGLK